MEYRIKKEGENYIRNDNYLCCCGDKNVVHNETAKFNKIDYNERDNNIQLF